MRDFSRIKLSSAINKYRGLTRDATFGLRQRFFRERAIFKKVQSNETGSFAIPRLESVVLGLRQRNTADIVGIKLDTNEVIKLFNRDLFRQGEPGEQELAFTIPEDKADQLGVRLEKLAPMQFVLGQVGVTSPSKQIRELGSRTNYTAADFMVWKEKIKKTPEGKSYVIIERNEKEYFNIESGDKVSITTIAVEGNTGENIKTFFNKARNTTVKRPASADRIYLGNIVSQLGYDEGTLVQCIAKPL